MTVIGVVRDGEMYRKDVSSTAETQEIKSAIAALSTPPAPPATFAAVPTGTKPALPPPEVVEP